MSEKDEEIRIIIEKLDSKTPYDHFEEIIKFIEDDDNHKIIRKKNLISLFLHKRYPFKLYPLAMKNCFAME